MARLARRTHLTVARLTAYADQSDDFVIPEDLSTLADDELVTLHEQAVANFDTLYNGGQGLTDADLAALATLTEGIEALAAERGKRDQAAAERTTAAAELAARAHLATDDPNADAQTLGPDGDSDDENGESQEENDGAAEEPPADAPADPSVTASAPARREIRVNLSGLRNGRPPALPRPAHEAQTMRDVVLASGEGTGFAPGTGVDWTDMARILDRRLTGFSESQYRTAAAAGRHMRQQFGIATIRKPMPPELTVMSNDPSHVEEVLARARNEQRLPGNSLVAAGGWCAPSEIIYDLCELESRDGLLSVPEIGVARGGIQWTTGPNFADIYNETGFCYTEQDAIDGDWDGNGGGAKPCYAVECPTFDEARLGLCGLCITSGLLQQRGYPELLARTLRGALIAHDHKMSNQMIAAMVTGSTAVTMTAAQVGAAAPLLDAIELQTEHVRYTARMARRATLEAVFPYWVTGVIRSDLARRQGLLALDVTDAQITAWFRSRGVNPQFVYDWQPLDGTAATAFTKWPANVTFLLYPAGTWVRGTADVITLDTIHDSVQLGQNEFTALFTEEGWLAAKLCHDSRAVTIALCPSGETGGGLNLACDGTYQATP
jgi:hypothetical protein